MDITTVLEWIITPELLVARFRSIGAQCLYVTLEPAMGGLSEKACKALGILRLE